MNINTNYSSEVEKYIVSFPEKIQALLRQMRHTIQQAAPLATEAMSYGIPTFKLNGNLVHFAAFKKHIGFYPTPFVLKEFKKELASYYLSKGAVQFPFDRPLPLTLIAKMVHFRVINLEGVK